MAYPLPAIFAEKKQTKTTYTQKKQGRGHVSLALNGGKLVNRRKFLQGVLGAIATVAIAAKVAPSFPELTKRVRLAYTITSEEMDEGMYGEIGERYAAALAKSMRETIEEQVYIGMTA